MFQNALHLTCPDFLRELYEYFVALKISRFLTLKLQSQLSVILNTILRGFMQMRHKVTKLH